MRFSELALWAGAAQSLVSNAPVGWQVHRLSELLTQFQTRVKVEPEKLYPMTGVKWYGEGIFLRETVAGKDMSASHVYPVVPGAFIYNRLFAWKASFAVTPQATSDQYVSSEFPQYDVDQTRLLPDYLYQYVLSEKVMHEINRASAGSAAVSRNRLKEAKFLELEIPLPPLATQQAIVRRWQELKAASAAAKCEAASLEQAAEQEFLHALGLKAPNEAKPRKVIGLRFTDLERWGVAVNQPETRLDVSASRYTTKTLGSLIADLENGWSPQCLDRPATPDEWGVLKLGAVSFGIFDQNENKALPKHLEPIPRYEVKSGDFIISRANIARLVGACTLVGKTRARLMLCDKLFRVVWKKESEVLPNYLDEALKIPHLRWQIENALTGTSPTMKNISKPSLLALCLPVPPLEIQRSLVADMESARARAAELRAEALRLQALAKEETEAAILGRAPTLASPVLSGVESISQEPSHDHPTTATPRPASEAMARRSSGRGQPARGVSPAAGGVRAELDGAGAGAGGPGPAARSVDSTQPLDATRELATAAGSLTYSEVSERLAVNIVRCLDAVLDAEPEDVSITPDWLREVHRCLAGELFPDWAGRFRATDVQVGTHFPPPAHAVAVQVRDFCLDLEERLRHLSGAESIADLLAWVDWRFQWIHPFKDFNGRVGRILLVTLTYKLDLPPVDPADEARKEAYFAALRAADANDPAPLREIWLRRLGG